MIFQKNFTSQKTKNSIYDDLEKSEKMQKDFIDLLTQFSDIFREKLGLLNKNKTLINEKGEKINQEKEILKKLNFISLNLNFQDEIVKLQDEENKTTAFEDTKSSNNHQNNKYIENIRKNNNSKIYSKVYENPSLNIVGISNFFNIFFNFFLKTKYTNFYSILYCLDKQDYSSLKKYIRYLERKINLLEISMKFY